MTTKWANLEYDAGALHALLAHIPEHVAVPLIDYLWIFPARAIAVGESVVVVVAAFDEDADRRRVLTAHFTVARNRKGEAKVTLRFDEHGAAPEAAVPRIVQGVLRRLGEDTETPPREELIGGDADTWNALIVELGGTVEPGVEEDSEVAGEGEPPDGGDS